MASVPKDAAVKLLEERRKALRLFLPFRKQIEEAGDGSGFLPEPNVLRAMCQYLAGDFVIWIDAESKEG